MDVSIALKPSSGHKIRLLHLMLNIDELGAMRQHKSGATAEQ
jgi:hypothetical protein